MVRRWNLVAATLCVFVVALLGRGHARTLNRASFMNPPVVRKDGKQDNSDMRNLISTCQDNVDVLFLLESPSPVNSNESWDVRKNFIEATIKNINVGERHTRVGYMEVGTGPKIVFNLNKFFDKGDRQGLRRNSG
eukprot:Selendium_serpulae@DN6339_c0_g1_i1.p1